MYRFRMPSLGADMAAGTLVEWLKQPGDRINRGDVVAVVETDKGAIEIEIFVDGAMGKQLVALGTKVPVGTPLAEIEGAKEEEPGTAEIPPALGKAIPALPTPALRQAKGPSEEKVFASPAARVRAAELGVPLSVIHGSGPNGSVVLRDVEQAAEAIPRRGLDLGKMRQAIAAAMSRSKREIPHYYLSHDINVSVAINWLEHINSERSLENRILLAAMILKSTALAVRKYQVFNGYFDPQKGFSPVAKVHIGSAVAIRGGGLVSPAIHNCDELSLDQLMARLSDLASRAREGRLRSSELSDATITVSNLGERGVQSLYGIIYPPQVAIVGFGTVVRRPAAVEDRIELCPLMTATLAADHRVSDGHVGARFLKEIDMRLQEPETL